MAASKAEKLNSDGLVQGALITPKQLTELKLKKKLAKEEKPKAKK